eukprot:COSAG06_NODE_6121_length_3099_cov_1.673000_3_plen_42_part_01
MDGYAESRLRLRSLSGGSMDTVRTVPPYSKSIRVTSRVASLT